jgi:transcriptional regulator with XRE-family HTH domain
MYNKLKDARKQKGLTQIDLAKLLKVPQSNISNFEKGKSKLNEDQIRELVKVLECSADYLLGLLDNSPDEKE